MPVYLLNEELAFPPPSEATDEGVLAIGGDYSPERLVLAYQHGIFPWPTEGYPLLWFSPDPRFVLEPQSLKVSRSLRKQLRRAPFEIVADRDFSEVIRRCGDTPRAGQAGTWITPSLIAGFEALHGAGLAHCVSAYADGELVGGLYGLSLGSVFFGESMFATRPDASKIAFVTLVANLRAWGFSMIDCQVPTDHLERFGARACSRDAFLRRLATGLRDPTRAGTWKFDFQHAHVLEMIE